MARLIYSEPALGDLELLAYFLLESDPPAALETAGLIEEVALVLRRHPLIGRSVESGFRGFVISRDRSGYVALYSYEEVEECVLALAIRHQREVGYTDSDAGTP